MSIEIALNTFLTDTSDGDQSQDARNTARSRLASQIGTRVRIGRREQNGITPSLTMRRMSSDRYNDLNGECGLNSAVMELTLWGREDAITPAKLLETADYLRQAIQHYRGTMGAVGVQGVSVLGDQMVSPIAPNDGSDHWLFGVTLDVLIHYAQTAVVAL